jgi:hypothetical protein
MKEPSLTERPTKSEIVFQADSSPPCSGCHAMRLLVPLEAEDFAVGRKRELLTDLRLLDAAMASLLDDVRATRMEVGGLASYQELPSPMISARMAALELGRSELINQRNGVLRELASL